MQSKLNFQTAAMRLKKSLLNRKKEMNEMKATIDDLVRFKDQ